MRKNQIVPIITALAGLLAGLSHAPANAALITVSGTDVDFTFDGSLLGLYGTPTVSGDDLFFSPAQFTSSSLNGSGMSSATATTFIDIQAHAGYTFGSLAFTEVGDYRLFGRNSTVNVDGGALAIDKNNPPASGPFANNFLGTSSNLGLSDGALHSWTAATQVDLSGSHWINATTVRVSLESMLDAYTATDVCGRPTTASHSFGHHAHQKHAEHRGESHADATRSDNSCGAQQAFIEANYIGLNLSSAASVPLAAVPLPSALALLLPGLLALLGIGAKQRAL